MRLCLSLLSLLVVSCGFAAGSSEGAEYQVGDRAREDVVAPVQLIVVDQERTELLRQNEARRVQVVFRHFTNVAAEAESKMLTAYATVKESFHKALARAYKKRKLDPETIDQPRFGQLVSTFQKQNRSFPLTTNVAIIWALGESDHDILEELATTLREAMTGLIRNDTLPALARSGPQQVRLVRVGASNHAINLDTALAESTVSHRTNLIALGRARKEMQAKFSGEQQWAGKFLAQFVRANCLFDEPLTLESRARRIDAILAADTYEAGRVIVRAGELIDARVKAALDELARRTEADQIKARAAEERRKAESVATRLEQAALDAHARSNATEKRFVALLVIFTVAGGFALAGMLVLARKRANAEMLPALRHADTVPGDVANPGVPPGLLPELSRWLRHHLVQRLLLRNVDLAETQRRAALQVAELERRLEEIQGPLQERLHIYEQRIRDLEAELAARGAENRELLKATIKMARARLDARRSKETAWN